MGSYRIASYFGGLGDSLMWSSFPEYLTSLGHEVFLYTGTDVIPIRNPEIKKLVWDMNPFIKGESTENWNCGDLPGVAYQNTEKCFIMNAEKMMGLEPKNWLPQIYYKPKTIAELPEICKERRGIIELSAIHHKYNSATVIANALELMKLRDDVKWVQLVHPNQSNAIILPGVPQLQIDNIFQLCDVIANSFIFLSLMSGAQSLAAAIQRINPHFEQYCFLPTHDTKSIMDSQKFVYPNVEYILA